MLAVCQSSPCGRPTRVSRRKTGITTATPPQPTTVDEEELPTAAPETPLAYRAVRSGLWIVGSSYWSIAFGFVANIFLTRLLLPANYGDFALAVFFFSLLQLRGKLGLQHAFTQHATVDGESVGTYFTLEVLLGAGGLLLMLVAAPILLALGYAGWVVAMAVILAAIAFLDSFGSVFSAVLGLQLRAKPGSVIGSIAMPFSYLAAFVLALTGHGNLSLIGQSVSFAALALTGTWLFIVRALRPLFRLHWRFSPALARQLFSFGLVAGVGFALYGLTTQVDNFLVGTIAGVDALGYYDRAYRTAQWPYLVLASLTGGAAIYTYARLQGDAERLRKSVTMVAWVSASLAAPVALVLFVTAPDFIHLVYGDRWLPAAPLLRVLVLVAILRPLVENANSLMAATGQPRRIAILAAAQLAVLMILGTGLTVLYGAMGMAAAVAVSFVVAILIVHRNLMQTVQIGVLDVFGVPLLAALLTVVGYIFLNRELNVVTLPLWLQLVLKAAYTFAAFYAILFVLQPRTTRARVHYLIRLARGR